MSTETDNNYLKYRGKCRQLSEAAIAEDPTLTLVRGFYDCPLWGRQAHWWTKRPDGTIYDPSVKQFPTAGVFVDYVEFDGTVTCAECGKIGAEEDFQHESNYSWCSTRCHMRFVGL